MSQLAHISPLRNSGHQRTPRYRQLAQRENAAAEAHKARKIAA
jgi:hypothetical protein